MRKIVFFALALVVPLAFFHACNEPLDMDNTTQEFDLKSANSGVKSYIVVLNDAGLNTELAKLKGYEKKKEAVKSTSAKILKRAGISGIEAEHLYSTALQGFSVKIPPGQLKKLQDDPSVKYVEEDQVVTLILPNEKIKGKPSPPQPQSQSIPWGITRVGTANGTGKTAWIIDSGIDLNHPDLNVDVARSMTVFTGKRSSPDDENGHGTHVAGTVAAINNNFGVVGVAAGATVVAVRVLDRSGSGSTSGVIAGVDYVAENASGSDVANMSLGGGISTALDNAVLNASASCKFTLAAGNNGNDANGHSPARVNGPNIYTVSAMDNSDRFASFSNYGSPVDYCEPGVSIYSCYKGGAYVTMSGTSMAAPHLAGLLLLGNVRTDGKVLNDPDGNADPIGVH